MKRAWPWLLLVVLVADGLLFYFWRGHRREHSQDGVILAATERYGVEPALVKAVVWRESRFNPKARGKAGEIGLMQIGEAAALEWSSAEKIPSLEHAQLIDPAKNTLAGTWYLQKLLRRYQQTDNPIVYALADYNAGRNNVLRWKKGVGETNGMAMLAQMDFPTTRQYVLEVVERYRHYRPLFKPRTGSRVEK